MLTQDLNQTYSPTFKIVDNAKRMTWASKTRFETLCILGSSFDVQNSDFNIYAETPSGDLVDVTCDFIFEKHLGWKYEPIKTEFNPRKWIKPQDELSHNKPVKLRDLVQAIQLLEKRVQELERFICL
jgi:hypothetical protein